MTPGVRENEPMSLFRDDGIVPHPQGLGEAVASMPRSGIQGGVR